MNGDFGVGFIEFPSPLELEPLDNREVGGGDDCEGAGEGLFSFLEPSFPDGARFLESLALSSGVFGPDFAPAPLMVAPPGCLILFLDLITSVLREIGLGRP